MNKRERERDIKEEKIGASKKKALTFTLSFDMGPIQKWKEKGGGREGARENTIIIFITEEKIYQRELMSTEKKKTPP